MVLSRLELVIEKHAEQLTEQVVHELRSDPRTPSYHKLNPKEDHDRVFAVVHHLGESLDCKSDAAMEMVYRNLGRKRFREGIPLAEVVCALMLTRQNISRFILAEAWMDSALDLCQRLELESLIDRFFERAVYFTVLSYEAEARSTGETATSVNPARKLAGGWALRKPTTNVV